MTKVIPMLFSGDMVRALLDGRKTQTRHVCKLPRNYAQIDFMGGRWDWDDPSAWGFEHPDTGHWALKGDGDIKEIPCPYGQPGDLIWVRETWAVAGNEDGHPIDADGAPCVIDDAEWFYRSDTTPVPFGLEALPDGRQLDVRWTPSIHMPRPASRLTLRIADVRVERVQDISDEDAVAEGVEPFGDGSAFVQLKDAQVYSTTRACFAALWQSICTKNGHTWNENPWVWAITFEAIHANVDDVIAKEKVA